MITVEFVKHEGFFKAVFVGLDSECMADLSVDCLSTVNACYISRFYGHFDMTQNTFELWFLNARDLRSCAYSLLRDCAEFGDIKGSYNDVVFVNDELDLCAYKNFDIMPQKDSDTVAWSEGYYITASYSPDDYRQFKSRKAFLASRA